MEELINLGRVSSTGLIHFSVRKVFEAFNKWEHRGGDSPEGEVRRFYFARAVGGRDRRRTYSLADS